MSFTSIGVAMSTNNGHPTKTSAITFEVESYRTGAILAHEDLSSKCRYPQLADDLFDWVLSAERSLGMETYSHEENQNDRASISLRTDTLDGQFNADGSRISLRTCEHFMFRIHAICRDQNVGITTLLRTAFDNNLAQKIIEKALASNDEQ